MQQASGSATQSSTTYAPMAAEPTSIPVADQEPEGSMKGSATGRSGQWIQRRRQNWTHAIPVNTPENGESNFIGKTFRRCLPKRKRWKVAKEYPKLSSSCTAVPKLNNDIKGALGKELPEKADTQLAKIQATVLAACTPLANFLIAPERAGVHREH